MHTTTDLFIAAAMGGALASMFWVIYLMDHVKLPKNAVDEAMRLVDEAASIVRDQAQIIKDQRETIRQLRVRLETRK